MEIIHEGPDIVVYDDFAHHPTAIQSDLDGLRRSLNAEDVLIAVIEPASHTMKSGIHQQTLNDATTGADHTLWLEPAKIGWDMHTLVSHHSHVHSTPQEIINHLDTLLRGSSGRCHVVLMSNGSFQNLREDLTAHLSSDDRRDR